MIPGPHTLFEIIDTGEVEQFRVTKIVFDIEASSKHTLTPPEDKPLDDETPDSCKEHNDAQVKTLLNSLAVVERYLTQFNGGTKRLAQRNICDLTLMFNTISITNNQLCPPYPFCIEDYVGEQDTSDCP